jgi:tetratricopeptide (TPR) repeat protein
VQPREIGKAVHYAVVAGARALDQLAPDEALRWYGQALDLLDRAGAPDIRTRAEILVGLGDAQLQCGVPAHRETLLDAAHLADEVDDVDLLVRAAIANSRGFESVSGAIDHDRVAVIDRALERLGDADSPARAWLLALACVERMDAGDFEERLSLGEAALATAERCGDPVARIHTIGLVSNGIRAPSTLALRRAQSVEACALADELGDPVPRYWAHETAFLDAIEAADYDTIEARFLAMEQEVHRIPDATLRWLFALESIARALLFGELEEAERRRELAVELGEAAGHPDRMAANAVQLTNLRVHQGRVVELIPLIEQVLAGLPGVPAFRAVLAMAHTHGGDAARAATLLREDRESGFAIPVDFRWSTAHASWADAAVRLRDTDAAPILREALEPFPDQIVSSTTTILPTVAHWLGRLERILGHYDEAEQWLTAALAHHEHLRSPMLVAYTRAAMAELLADRDHGDDRERAHDLATRTLTTATAGGYGMIAADASAVLQRLD